MLLFTLILSAGPRAFKLIRLNSELSQLLARLAEGLFAGDHAREYEARSGALSDQERVVALLVLLTSTREVGVASQGDPPRRGKAAHGEHTLVR